jgi:hypothetical protein
VSEIISVSFIGLQEVPLAQQISNHRFCFGLSPEEGSRTSFRNAGDKKNCNNGHVPNISQKERYRT